MAVTLRGEVTFVNRWRDVIRLRLTATGEEIALCASDDITIEPHSGTPLPARQGGNFRTGQRITLANVGATVMEVNPGSATAPVDGAGNIWDRGCRVTLEEHPDWIAVAESKPVYEKGQVYRAVRNRQTGDAAHALYIYAEDGFHRIHPEGTVGAAVSCDDLEMEKVS